MSASKGRQMSASKGRQMSASKEDTGSPSRSQEPEMSPAFCRTYLYRGTSLIRNRPPEDFHKALSIVLL